MQLSAKVQLISEAELDVELPDGDPADVHAGQVLQAIHEQHDAELDGRAVHVLFWHVVTA